MWECRYCTVLYGTVLYCTVLYSCLTVCVGVQDTKLGDGLRLVSVFQGVLEVVAAAIQTLFIHQLSIKVDIQF